MCSFSNQACTACIILPMFVLAGKTKRSVLAGDSDDEDLPNTYDYNDSFIDDVDVSEGELWESGLVSYCTMYYKPMGDPHYINSEQGVGL